MTLINTPFSAPISAPRNTFLHKKDLISFISGDHFKEITKTLIEAYCPDGINPEEALKDIYTSEKIFDSFECNSDLHKKYGVFIAKGSEFFIEELLEHNKKEAVDESEFFFKNTFLARTVRSLTHSTDVYEKLIARSLMKTKHYCINPTESLKPKKSFKFIKLAFNEAYELLNEDCEYFRSVINHIKNIVFPNIKDRFSRPVFVVNDKTIDTQSCKLPGGDLDFFEANTQSIVELKFENLPVSEKGLGQTLLYLYLVEYCYGIRLQGVKVLNIYTGMEFDIRIEDFCKDRGVVGFFAICKLYILNLEKNIFRDDVRFLHNNYLYRSTLDERVVGFVFKGLDPKTSYDLCQFLRKLFIPKNSENLDDANWLWEKRINYLKK